MAAAAAVLATAGAGVALSATAATSPPAPVRPPPGAPASFADIIQRVSPAVVSIDVTRPAEPRNTLPEAFRGLPFGFPFPLQPPNGGGGQRKAPDARVAGSGFFISADGYVVTNNHVVERATKVTVKLSDGRELPAKVVGADPLTDLAVVKVEGRGFPFVSFETQARPRVGDWVVAVGNPFGLGGTATAGIVSAYGRDIGEAYVDYLQIDAPINRGNSGGPTFDVYGRVIGVNSQIFSPSGGSVGIGFAIPSDVAANITRRLIAEGSITRGYLGAYVQNLTPAIAESLGLKGRKGALVAEVTAGGPADQAGLKSGDAVLAMDGRRLESAADLTRRIGEAHEGQALRLEIWRDGRSQTVTVRAGKRPAEDQAAGPAAGGTETLGMALRPLDDETRRRLRLPPGQRGVVVGAVLPGSDAARQGLRPGDVIEEVGGRAVASPADVRQAVAAAQGQGRDSVLVRAMRDGHGLYLALELPPPPKS
jgi:serine protease Do